jgi:hypothetical protein
MIARPAMERLRSLTFAAPVLFTALAPSPVRGDAPPPTQALDSDPRIPFGRVEISADGAAIAFGDYALRFDVAPEPWISVWACAGLTRRHGSDAVLLESGIGLWPLGKGLEGLWIAPVVGIAIAGPWNGESPTARSNLRFGGDIGWQFLWGALAIAVGAGGTGFATLQGPATVWIEPRIRAAIGVVGW